MKKYLKTYTAITSGSMAGRDDGYPYTAYQVFENIEDLAKSHGKKQEEQYFEIYAVTNNVSFENEIQLANERIEKKKQEEVRAQKVRELQKLKYELGEI